jgi:ribonuclease R
VRALRKGAAVVKEEYAEQLAYMAEHCSLREREAMEAERESLQTKQLMFMSDKLGDVFKGRITGVHSYGLFVEIVDYLVEGLIHISALDDDYYAYIEERHCLLGENTGKSFRLGDEISVQVVRVDIEKRRMDFVLANGETEKLEKQEPKKGKHARSTAAGTQKTRPGRRSKRGRRGGSTR